MISTRAKTVPNSELDAFAILRSCWQGFVPVNAKVAVTIEAHDLAFKQFEKSKDKSDWPVAQLTLRAVWLATPHSREEAQRLFDYLNGLPMLAWQNVVSGDAVAVRESILADCARMIAERTDA